MKELLQEMDDATRSLQAGPAALRGYWEVVIDSLTWAIDHQAVRS